MITYQHLVRFNRWLISLQERRIPQAFVLVSGLSAIGIGALFQSLPDRMESAPSVDYLTNVLGPEWWAGLFFIVGTALAILSIARYHWSWAVSAVMALVMFTFSAFTIVDVAEGPATGLVALLSWSFGALNLLSGIMAVAPVNAHVADIHHHEKDAA